MPEQNVFATCKMFAWAIAITVIDRFSVTNCNHNFSYQNYAEQHLTRKLGKGIKQYSCVMKCHYNGAENKALKNNFLSKVICKLRLFQLMI